MWSNQTINTIRTALNLRYSLLPYLYTLFYLAHTTGETVARPLFMQYVTISTVSCDLPPDHVIHCRFPKDKKTWTIETQFMWGDGLLISPVLAPGVHTVNAYLPPYERWYDVRQVSNKIFICNLVVLVGDINDISRPY